MAQTIYQSYNAGEEARFAGMSQQALHDIAQQQAQQKMDLEQGNEQQQYDQVSIGQQGPSMRHGVDSIANATNPMALSPEQLIAVKAMNQRNNASYLSDIAKKSRDSGNIADSQKYAQFAKQFTKNAASLDKDALTTRREILADDSLMLRSVNDQQSLNNVVALAELRGRPMTELLSMTDDGLYSSKTKNYVDSRLGQLGHERDWIDVNTQVLDDETRYYDRLSNDKRTNAYDMVQMRQDSIRQQNLVKDDRNRRRQEEKLQGTSLNNTPQSYEDLMKRQKAALRNTLSDKQIKNLEGINPELATIERQRRNDISDPVKYAESIGYDLNRDTKQLQSLSDKARSTIKALPSSDVLLQEWRSAKKKAPSEEELDSMKFNKDPMYDTYKAQAEQVDTIDKYVKNKYGVDLTQDQMNKPEDRILFTDDTGQDVTLKALKETAISNRMSLEQVMRGLGMSVDEIDKLMNKYPAELKGQM